MLVIWWWWNFQGNIQYFLSFLKCQMHIDARENPGILQNKKGVTSGMPASLFKYAAVIRVRASTVLYHVWLNSSFLQPNIKSLTSRHCVDVISVVYNGYVGPVELGKYTPENLTKATLAIRHPCKSGEVS
ncbi:unnamed protein product, partial [Owenia fusiformis]